MKTENWITEALTFKNKLYRLANWLLGDTEEAADAVQETYIKLWKMNHQREKYHNTEALAMTITKNYCLDQLKSKRWKTVSFDKSKHAPNMPIHNNTQTKVELDEAQNMIKLFVSQLPQQQQIVMQLRDVEQMEFEEIEAITGMNQNAIRVNLSRARKTIRQQLTNQYSYEYTGN
jgi:RNA polymerase sigma factor (sigma-70 family)